MAFKPREILEPLNSASADKFVQDSRTYPEYLEKTLVSLYSGLVAGLFEKINPGNYKFILKDNGIQVFILLKFLEDLYLDHFISSLSVEHFFETTETQIQSACNPESVITTGFDVRSYSKSLEDSKLFLLGTLSQERSLEIVNLFKSDLLNNISVDIVSKISRMIELVFFKFKSAEKGLIADSSLQTFCDSAFYSNIISDLDCDSISQYKLPFLIYSHSVDCDTCFTTNMSFEAINRYKDDLDITILFSFFHKFSLAFSRLYSAFADSESIEVISSSRDEFGSFLKELYDYTLVNKVSTMSFYFNHLKKLEKARIRKELRANQKLKAQEQRAKQELEARLEEERRDQERRALLLAEEQRAKQELEARLEQSNRDFEVKAIKEKEYQAEQLLRKINHVLAAKSEILNEIENVIQQLELSEFDSSVESVRWKKDLKLKLQSLCDQFKVLSDFDEVEVSDSLEISLDFTVDEFDEYNSELDKDFLKIIG